jgi:predicted RecB family nuclease
VSSLMKEGYKTTIFTPERFARRVGLLVDAKLEADDLLASLDILTKATTESGTFCYEPTLISGHYSIQFEDKLKLLFSAYVLTQLQGTSPKHGFIVTTGGATKKVTLENDYGPIIKAVDVLRHWASSTSAQAPRVIINKHCNVCQFRHQCRKLAEDLDDLSLLDRMTPKILAKYHKKGIFTVQQLSYLFRSRRVRKRNSYAPVRFNFELQALAIRTKKIYIHAPPEVTKNTLRLFLDIEGIPDQRFYYLFGLLVVDENNKTYYAHWANDTTEEAAAWTGLLNTISRFPDAPIFHYGNYEARAVDHLQKRHAVDSPSIKNRLINVTSFVFGKVYFPVLSNSQKELGRYLGTTWTRPEASGLQSLVWRHWWERSRDESHKESLLTYNQEDCAALSVLVDFLTNIGDVCSDYSKVQYADKPAKDATELGVTIHNQFETILRSACADYNKNKITVRRPRLAGTVQEEKVARNTGHQAYVRLVPRRFGKVVRLPSPKRCPEHKRELLRISDQAVQKIVTDLVFAKYGCRKVITQYVGYKSYCWRTGKRYLPSGFEEIENTVFGHSFKAWIIYQRIVVRLPYGAIIQSMAELFHERISEATIVKYLCEFSAYYEQSEKRNVQLLLLSPAIYVDETQINIQGTNHYVWVFTDGEHVVFRFTETRESTLVHDLLSDCKGVLVSDFYPGYDSVSCAQQKCWVHLIRDMNEDLWKALLTLNLSLLYLK